MLNKNDRQQHELNKYYHEKINLRLKYTALISIALSIILILIIAFGQISGIYARLFLQGCAGLFALIFVVLTGIIVYRVNTTYLNDKYR